MIRRLWKIAIIVGTITLTGVCFYYLFLYSPELVWDKSPNTLVIYTGIGVREIDYNYIPDFRLWGDGHVIWVKHSPNGKRTVLEGHLSEKDILNILETLKTAGFFKTRFNFGREEDQRCAYQGFEDGFLYVDLIRSSYGKEIWKVDNEICAAVNDLVTGAGIVGLEHVPTVGKIYFVPLEQTDLPPDVKEVYPWPDSDFRFNPEMIISSKKNGMEIMGEELKLAWEIVNSSTRPVVVSNGKKYWMAVTIKGISTVYE